ncbi:MAG: hypothetical protein KDN18_12375 [Verrucomicrobiae bacterium]|nr:hypothetical protein [Verrucomicrobiae bacterium]
MKTGEGWLVFLTGSTLACLGALAADEGGKGKAEQEPPRELARLDIANSKEGSIPGGASVVKGSWAVDAGAKKLVVAAEPLLEGWLEFGPEIREKGASITASGRAPGSGRLQSRFGVGLYGRNGFQLRLVPVRQEVELVHRGEVILSRPFPHDPSQLQQVELSVRAERQHWIVSGRAWKEGEDRPEDLLFEHKVFAVELLFPLAGKAVLVATPFSGEPISFASAVVTPEKAD